MKLHEDNPGKALTPRASRSANGSNKKDSKRPKKTSLGAPRWEHISIVKGSTDWLKFIKARAKQLNPKIVPIENEPSTSAQPAQILQPPNVPMFHLQDHHQVTYEAQLEHPFNYKPLGTLHPNNMLNN